MSIAELPNEPFRSSKVPLVDAIKMWQLSTADGKHFKDLKVEDIFHHSWHFYKDFYFSAQSGRVYCSPPSIYCGQINGQWCRRRRHLRKRLKIKVFHMGSDCVRLRERCSNRFLHLPFEKVDKTRNFAREMNNPNFTNLDCSSLPITNSIFN